MVLTDNPLNVPGAQQTITLSGKAIPPSTTSVSCSPNPATYDTQVSCTAAVSDNSPTGFVNFYLGGSCASPGAVIQENQLSGGTASTVFLEAFLDAPGSLTVLACYLGDSNNGASSGTAPLTVIPASR